MISRLVHLHVLETCEKLDAAFAYGWEIEVYKVYRTIDKMLYIDT